jgi:hypothetical protein
MTKVLLTNEKEQFSGLLCFDGDFFEAFGFVIGGGFEALTRIPLELIGSVSASFDSGMLKTPRLEIAGRDDLGFEGSILIPIDPDPSEQAAVAQLADEVQKAVSEGGGA